MPTLPASSAIPAATVAFLSIATGALPAGTTVWFGKELSTYSTPLTLQVSGIVGTQDWAEMGPNYNREEEFSFVCTLSYYQGGEPDFLGIMSTLMSNFALLTAAIGNNPWLALDGTKQNGTVRVAEVGNFIIEPITDINGLSCMTIEFQVRCKQRVRSLASS